MRKMRLFGSALETTTKQKSMKCNKFTTKSLVKVLACTIVALGAISLAQAQDKVDPTGTWTWVAQGGRGGGGGGGGGGGRRGGGGGTNVLVLKLDGTKLTGTLTAPRGGGRRATPPPDDGTTPATPPPPATTKTDIADGKWVASTATVSFNVTLPARGGGDPTVVPYTGVVTADKITGTYTPPARGGGDPMPRDWVATKQKPAM
jgi:hypothetical protein